MYIVTRNYGKRQADFLNSLNDEWGTVCTARSGAMTFPTYESARAGARKARRACMGWNGHNKVRARVSFTATAA